MKESLELEIAKLKKIVEQHEEQAKDLKNDLGKATSKLADLEKPKLTQSQMDDLVGLIERAVDDFGFDYGDRYDVDLSIYGREIEIESIAFREQSQLAEEIADKVLSMFGEADESDDTDSTECSVPSE